MASTSQEPVNREQTPEVQEMMFRTKSIHFFKRKTRVILQKENGPCALIAICNNLLLRNNMDLNPDEYKVSESRLLTLVAERLIATCIDNYNPRDVPKHKLQRISNALELLPGFIRGVNVDINFNKITDIELTRERDILETDIELARERDILDILDIPLYHGWIIDPKDSETANAIGDKSYDELKKELVDLQTSSLERMEITETDDSCKIVLTQKDRLTFDKDISSLDPKLISSTATKGELIRNFLDNNASQLTPYGLYRLKWDLPEGELGVFFRNNHFNTMYKHHGGIYTLVTDRGLASVPGLVWEKFREDQINLTSFANSNFKSLNSHPNNEESEEDNAELHSTFKHIAHPNKTPKLKKVGLSYKKPILDETEKAKTLEEIAKAKLELQSLRDPPKNYSLWRPQSGSSKKESTRKKLKDKCNMM